MGFRLAVFASGRGTNLQSILDQGFNVSLIVSDKRDAKALERAKQKNIAAFFLDPEEFSSVREYEKKLLDLVSHYKCDLICLAGFMRILSPFFIKNARMKILNIHPSLLPSFPGLDAHQQAIDYGVRFSGCTVHIVDEGLDSGPIVLQAVVPVEASDTAETLSDRILVEEHRIYAEAVRLIVEDKLEIEGRRVIIKE